VSDPVERERHVLDALSQASRLFWGLPRQHPDELREWGDAFHRLQDLIAVRIARAYRPDIYPIKES
jgi:hypothetical protein